MAEILKVDEFNPSFQDTKILKEALKAGRVIACPTENGYSYILEHNNRAGIKLLQKSFSKEKKHPVALFPEVALLAKTINISQSIFKLVKKNTPSSCTFILEIPPATCAKILHERKAEIAVRIPAEQVLQQLFDHAWPLVAFGVVESSDTTFSIWAEELLETTEIPDLLIIDYERPILVEPSTIVNCCSWPANIVRAGAYDLLN